MMEILALLWYTLLIFESLMLALVILTTSLTIPLSPGDVWFPVSTQSFLVIYTALAFTVPIKKNIF